MPATNPPRSWGGAIDGRLEFETMNAELMHFAIKHGLVEF